MGACLVDVGCRKNVQATFSFPEMTLRWARSGSFSRRLRSAMEIRTCCAIECLWAVIRALNSIELQLSEVRRSQMSWVELGWVGRSDHCLTPGKTTVRIIVNCCLGFFSTLCYVFKLFCKLFPVLHIRLHRNKIASTSLLRLMLHIIIENRFSWYRLGAF